MAEPLPNDLLARRFEPVAAYFEAIGGYRMGDGVRIGDRPLSKLTEEIRRRHRRGSLPAAIGERFERIPGWRWEPAKQPSRQAQLLTRYAASGGTFSPLPRNATFEGYQLSRIVKTVRSSYQRGSIHPTTLAAVEALPGWTWAAGLPSNQEWLALLRQYIERTGSARVPASHVEDGYNLGSWVSNQRAAYRNGSLSDERAHALSRLPGWTWPVTRRAKQPYRDWLALLNQYAERTGHTRVPKHHVEDGWKLGVWVHLQRLARRKGRLREDRVHLLNQMPGWLWDPSKEPRPDPTTPVHLVTVIEHQASQTGAPDPYSAAGQQLRHLYAEDTLAPELRQRLEAVPGWSWGQFLTLLIERCDLVAEFVAKHQRIPSRTDLDARGKKFGNWVDCRRREFRAGTLHPIITHRLEAIPGWTWGVANDRGSRAKPPIHHSAPSLNPPDPVLLRQYTQLARYLRFQGTPVPQPRLADGTPVGPLTKRIRADYRAGRLSPSLVERMENVPGWTWEG